MVFWGFIILALFEAGFIVAVQLYLATSNVQQIAVLKALSATHLNFSMCMFEENKCKPLNFLSGNLNKNNNKNRERKQQSNQHSFHPLERRITLLSSTVSKFLDAKVLSGDSGVNGRWVVKWQVRP